MDIKEVLVQDLKPAEYNPRIMSDPMFFSLVRSIEENGFVEPIVINGKKGRENIVIGGHQRLRAAKELGMESVPCVVVFMGEAEEKRLNVALNGVDGVWDLDKLSEVVHSLSLQDIDLGGTGLGDVMISGLLDRRFGEEDLEALEPTVEEAMPTGDPSSIPGTVYEIGPHRIMCGDSTKLEDVQKLMGTAKADIIFTDPPYNVNYESDDKGKIMNDSMSDDDFLKFSRDFFNSYAFLAQKGAPAYICTGYSSYALWYYIMANAGFYFSTNIVWMKNSATIAYSDYNRQYEQVMKAKTEGKPRWAQAKQKDKAEGLMYGWREGEAHPFHGKQKSDVWAMPRKDTSKMVHPTEKPEWLIQRALMNSSTRGQLVVDLFGGSGSTLMASHKLGRICYTMELDPKFCDVIRKRAEWITNKGK